VVSNITNMQYALPQGTTDALELRFCFW